MSEAQPATQSSPRIVSTFRDWFADHLGVDQERKKLLYVDLSSAATLLDATYWLQILFAAGIATLGLVLNSPAVIIGAMLISPLMGPILSGGLALATGDVILGLRAVVNLVLSCLLAVGFAVLLVGLLPFKEMTAEIASRTKPTTLDLVVALFSGAIGSIATCRQVKGVVTSIPGVAIAVALMPPLCVVGYGVGFAFSVNGSEGMRVAGGGGLLFLTNLVAITFTAMIVFVILHIDTPSVRNRIEEWRAEDPESCWFRSVLGRLHVSGTIRRIGSLPGRLLLIAVPILVILIPLAQSFNQLKREINTQQYENRIRQAATTLWQQNFGKLPGGEPRSSIDQLSILSGDGGLTLQFRVFTSKTLSSVERSEYLRTLSARVGAAQDSVNLQLVEVPTASPELAARTREERRETPETIAALQAKFIGGLNAALRDFTLPPPAQLISYGAVVSAAGGTRIQITYLSDRDIDTDGRTLLAEDLKRRLSIQTTTLSLERIDPAIGPLPFGRNESALTTVSEGRLDASCSILARNPALRIEIIAGYARGEREEIGAARRQAIVERLSSLCQIDSQRIIVAEENGGRDGSLRLSLLEPR